MALHLPMHSSTSTPRPSLRRAGTVETNAVNNSATSTTNVTNAAATSADVAVSLNGPTTVQPSAPVVYTVVVDNNGPASGNGTTLSAPVPAVVTNVTTTCTASGGAVCPSVAAGNNINAVIPTLPMGGELTFTITGTAPTSGTFSESATVTPATGTNDPVPSNNTAGPVVTTVPVLSADLSIQKNGPDQVLAGAVINYTIVVSNAGPNAGDGASVTDVLPAGLSNASVVCSAATGGAACGTAAITAGTLHAVAGALPVAGSITLTVSAKAPASGTLSNSASVAPPAGVSDPNMANNSSGPVQTTIVSSIATQADLSAAISGPSLVAPNGTVTYVVTITNAGPAAGNGALISDVLPTVLTNISAVCGNTIGGATCGAVAVNGKTVSSSIGTLPVGASLTLTITATAPASGTFSNSASVGAAPGETDPNTANNVAGPVVTSIGTATGTANLGISKTGPDMAGAGSSFSYTLLVSNAGPAAANGALVSDAVPAGLTNIHATCSAPTNGALCGAVQVSGQNVTSAVQALPALGTVTITVTVTAPVPSGLQPTTVVNRATITPPAGINDPDTSDNVSNAVETSIVSAGVSGTVWLDINHDKKLDAGDPLLAHWIVELFHNGVLVATTTTNAQGQYGFSGVAPGPGYSLDFRDPGSKAIYGTPTNGNEGVPNPDSNAVIGNGIIQSLTLKPGINIVQQSLPVDPSGVVYDATVRTPVGGATVTLVGPAGFNPATELVGGAGNVTQITESTGPTAGAYQFLLDQPGSARWRAGRDLHHRRDGAGRLSANTCQERRRISHQARASACQVLSVPPHQSSRRKARPRSATTVRGTIYYFNLVFNPGSGAVINNNVPLDRISGGALTVQKDRQHHHCRHRRDGAVHGRCDQFGWTVAERHAERPSATRLHPDSRHHHHQRRQGSRSQGQQRWRLEFCAWQHRSLGHGGSQIPRAGLASVPSRVTVSTAPRHSTPTWRLIQRGDLQGRRQWWCVHHQRRRGRQGLHRLQQQPDPGRQRDRHPGCTPVLLGRHLCCDRFRRQVQLLRSASHHAYPEGRQDHAAGRLASGRVEQPQRA